MFSARREKILAVPESGTPPLSINALPQESPDFSFLAILPTRGSCKFSVFSDFGHLFWERIFRDVKVIGFRSKYQLWESDDLGINLLGFWLVSPGAVLTRYLAFTLFYQGITHGNRVDFAFLAILSTWRSCKFSIFLEFQPGPGAGFLGISRVTGFVT